MTDLTIRDLQKRSHGTAVEKGWWEDWDRNLPEQLALFHSEISEALEEYRNGRSLTETYRDEKGKPCGFPIELADLLIRVADTCERYGIDLTRALEEKMAFNVTRPHRHGGKKA